MGAVLDTIVTIGKLIVSLVDFLINFIEDLIYVIGLLGSMLLKIPDMIGWLPSACITLTLTAFSIVVIYKVMGREG